MRVLFLTHRLPYPPNRGDRIRSYRLLTHLAAHATVDLLSLVHSDEEAAQAHGVRSVAHRVELARVSRVHNAVSALAALPAGVPMTHALLDSPDLGACVRHAREKLGYQQVVLAGWSGGGSLSAFYQAEAERPSVRATPAGDPPDLTAAGLLPADGLMLLAAHVSRARTLTEWLDASIVDEARPELRDRDLDLYDPAGPARPPYPAEFLQRYRAAQETRNRRITAWVKARLAALRTAGRDNEEHCFVVHGTMADPRWLDPAVDPNDRRPGWCFLGEPRVVNNSPVGLARFCSLRSWLSQWSLDDSNADSLAALRRVSVPVLVVSNSADDAATPSHARRMFEAVGHECRQMEEIKGANHYYFGQPREAQAATDVVRGWLEKHDLAG